MIGYSNGIQYVKSESYELLPFVYAYPRAYIDDVII